MQSFEKAYTDWLDKHKSEAKGERLRRITKNHGYGEKLLIQQAWWPVVGCLDCLSPEYEVRGLDGKYYFIDLAYLRSPRPTGLESDSFGSHARDIDRDEFSRGLDRQNEILLSDWHMIRFSTDKLKENPLACQQTIRRMLTNWYGNEDAIMAGLNVYQREIVRIALRSNNSFSIDEIRSAIDKGEVFSRNQLHTLVELNILESAFDGKRKRIHRYRLKRPNSHK